VLSGASVQIDANLELWCTKSGLAAPGSEMLRLLFEGGVIARSYGSQSMVYPLHRVLVKRPDEALTPSLRLPGGTFSRSSKTRWALLMPLAWQSPSRSACRLALHSRLACR
jgi:hypothetical protein